MHFSTVFRIFLALSFVTLATACQPARRALKFDTGIQLNITAAKIVNPDRDGRASPVVIRVFKLADDRQFSREDFLNLYEDADNRLGKDLLGTIVLKEMAPGETREEEAIELSTDVKFVGLLAEFIQYQDAEAIQVVPITDHKINKYSISLKGTKMLAYTPKKKR